MFFLFIVVVLVALLCRSAPAEASTETPETKAAVVEKKGKARDKELVGSIPKVRVRAEKRRYGGAPPPRWRVNDALFSCSRAV